MTALKQRIVRLIEAAGPIGVADYMALCLFDSERGYYTTRDPFGRAGDFTTAPEISQLFGELIGVWACSSWAALGRPAPFTLAEIGPGRGTLMKDMLRTLARIGDGFAEAATIAMVEASPRLADVQKETLRDAPARLEWHANVSALAQQPLILVGNELFDALPVRQYVKDGNAWRERVVAADGDDLVFAAGAGALDPALLPPDAAAAPDGAIFEFSPAREALMKEIADRIARDGGVALFIDYGHAATAVGDTLQAVRNHRFDDVLAHPGEADLTSHVDFDALARIAQASSLECALMTQGEFLLAMGLLERAGRLGAGGEAADRERILQEVERLAGPGAMGKLFKVLAIFPSGVNVPPFAQAD